MGAVSPSRFDTVELREQIMKIIRPVAKGMAAEGNPYRDLCWPDVNRQGAASDRIPLPF